MAHIDTSKIKIGNGEKLQVSYFSTGGDKCLFLVSKRPDGVFVLYSVTDNKIATKIRTAKSPLAFDGDIAKGG